MRRIWQDERGGMIGDGIIKQEGRDTLSAAAGKSSRGVVQILVGAMPAVTTIAAITTISTQNLGFQDLARAPVNLQAVASAVVA